VSYKLHRNICTFSTGLMIVVAWLRGESALRTDRITSDQKDKMGVVVP